PGWMSTSSTPPVPLLPFWPFKLLRRPDRLARPTGCGPGLPSPGFWKGGAGASPRDAAAPGRAAGPVLFHAPRAMARLAVPAGGPPPRRGDGPGRAVRLREHQRPPGLQLGRVPDQRLLAAADGGGVPRPAQGGLRRARGTAGRGLDRRLT